MAQTGQPGSGPDLSTAITRFYGGTVDHAQPQFRLNQTGTNNGSCLIWNSLVTAGDNQGAPWRRIVSVWAQVTTSAVVKTRFIEATYTDNQSVFFDDFDFDFTIAASLTVTIGGAIKFHPTPINTAGGPGLRHARGLPDIWLPPGCAFQFGLGNFDAGDTMLEARLLVEEAGPLLQAYSQPPVYTYGQKPALA